MIVWYTQYNPVRMKAAEREMDARQWISVAPPCLGGTPFRWHTNCKALKGYLAHKKPPHSPRNTIRPYDRHTVGS